MTVAGSWAASHAALERLRARWPRPSATCALAFSISASRRVELLDVLDDDADLAGLLVVDLAADEHDRVGRRSRSSAAASAFSKTTISTEPSRSSSVANIIVEPERVRIFL